MQHATAWCHGRPCQHLAPHGKARPLCTPASKASRPFCRRAKSSSYEQQLSTEHTPRVPSTGVCSSLTYLLLQDRGFQLRIVCMLVQLQLRLCHPVQLSSLKDVWQGCCSRLPSTWWTA